MFDAQDSLRSGGNRWVTITGKSLEVCARLIITNICKHLHCLPSQRWVITSHPGHCAVEASFRIAKKVLYFLLFQIITTCLGVFFSTRKRRVSFDFLYVISQFL